jgi:NADH-quinone oxidoreductase subunit M
LIGVLYDRYKTKNVLELGGLSSVMPIFSTFFFLSTLANISFPLTSNFAGELLVVLGTATVDYFTCILSVFSIILTTIYSI